jgi:hypothetical protein
MIDRTYKRAIGRIRLLDADEEQTLAALIAKGDDAARDRMIRATPSSRLSRCFAVSRSRVG